MCSTQQIKYHTRQYNHRYWTGGTCCPTGGPELTEYKDLFDCNTVGKLHPTICATSRLPLATKDKIIHKLNRMTKPIQGRDRVCAYKGL